MRLGRLTTSVLCLVTAARALPASQIPIQDEGTSNRTISATLFAELEELARLVDISYCVGATGLGIQKPFQCLSRCSDFPNFELVTTWNTGPLLSDSCGYIALSHPPSAPRVIVAFRGTYSIANTIADLSTVPQEYLPYPGGDDDTPKCTNCTVHSGFYRSWLSTRSAILPDLARARAAHPDYVLTLVGHSLGGAVATLAALDMHSRGWKPRITTFGEPRVGNEGLTKYIDAHLVGTDSKNSTFHRVTHSGDPVPLLPLEEWGYRPHSGELYISKSSLPPGVADIEYCDGYADTRCIAVGGVVGGAANRLAAGGADADADAGIGIRELQMATWPWESGESWTVPARFKLWQLFFAHRDYFWRLGLCVPGGDPRDWYRKYPKHEDEDADEL